MGTEPDGRPNVRDAAQEARRAREQREADALRENLRRRKAQARAQSGARAEDQPAVLPDDTP